MEIEALTAWALLGSYDWDSLLTIDAGRYEAGVFEIRGDRVAETPLTTLIRQIALDGSPSPEMSDAAGWWTRLDRLEHPPHTLRSAVRPTKRDAA